MRALTAIRRWLDELSAVQALLVVVILSIAGIFAFMALITTLWWLGDPFPLMNH